MSKDDKLVSLSGAPIYRHGEPATWSAPKGEECLEQISDHIEAHLGPVAWVLHEIASDTVHIDVHVVLPTAQCPCVRLVTSGMSDLPMTVPADVDAPRHLELLMTLPADWKLDEASFADENWYWPVRLLKTLARLPHKHATWLGWGHTMPNGDPTEPYASDTPFTGAILLPPLSVPEEFQRLRIDEHKEIAFYAVFPLHDDEMDLKLRRGARELLQRFDAADLDDRVDPARPSVVGSP